MGVDIQTLLRVNTNPAPLIAFEGDSRTANGLFISGNTTEYSCHGSQYWVPFLLGGRAETRPELNFGVSGNTTADLVARVDSVIATCKAAGVGLLVVWVGTNDAIQSFDFVSVIKPNLEILKAKYQAAGFTIIWVQETTRGSAAFTAQRYTATQQKIAERIVNWIDAQRFALRSYVADARESVLDMTTAFGDYLPNLTYDGTHPGGDGSLRISTVIAATIAPLLSPNSRPSLPAGDWDAYDVTYNPTGCLHASPMMLGTGGSISAGGATSFTGNVPTNWTAAGASAAGVSVVCSKVTASDGLEWAQMAISGTPTSSGCFISFNSGSFHASAVAGDVIESVARIQVDAGWSGIGALRHRTTATVSAVGYASDWGDGPAQSSSDGRALAGVSRAPRFTIPGGSLTALQSRIGVTLVQNVAASITLRARAAKSCKIGV